MATLRSASAITSAAGCIRAQWKGALTGKQDGALGALGLGDLEGAFDRRPVAGDDDLPGALSLAAWQTSPCAASAATATASAKSRPKKRRHGAGADRRCRLHGAAAGLKQARRIGERKCAGRRQRRIFAERMAGDEFRGPGKCDAVLDSPARASPPCSPPSSAGWAFSVSVSSASGPSHMSCERFWPSASSTSANTARAAGTASASALPMPTAWLPCPGNVNAIAISAPSCDCVRWARNMRPELSQECSVLPISKTAQRIVYAAMPPTPQYVWPLLGAGTGLRSLGEA